MTNEKNASLKATPATADKTTLHPPSPSLPPKDPSTPTTAGDVSPQRPVSAHKPPAPAAAAQAETLDDTAETKMAVATRIFTALRANPGVTRKQVLERFMSEAKLSKAGASTYYQLIQAKMK